MKKIISLTLTILIVFSVGITAFATDDIHPESPLHDINMDVEDDIGEASDANISTRGVQGYRYWKVTSKTTHSYYYGGWRSGPSGKGPGTVSVSNSSGVNRSVSVSISGSYTSAATIGAALGVTIGKSKDYSVGYSISVPSGKRYQILLRPRMKKIKVVQTEYQKSGINTHKPTGQTKTSYVSIFANWDYTWKQI